MMCIIYSIPHYWVSNFLNDSFDLRNTVNEILPERWDCLYLCAVLWRPPVEDSPASSVTAAAAEAGALLTVQCCGLDPADVHVRPAGPLDGVCLVLHRSKGDWEPRIIRHRLVRPFFISRKHLCRLTQSLFYSSLIFVLGVRFCVVLLSTSTLLNFTGHPDLFN